MKRIIAIVLLCWSAGVMAEEKVWYCVEVEKAGLQFVDGKYEVRSFVKKNRLTIKQEGSRFTFPDKVPYSLFDEEVECRSITNTYGTLWFACTSSGLSTVFILNPDTGLASLVVGGGGALKDKRPEASSSVDTMYVTALECETF
tara:strand:- start:609 stop:1040 length:432 start_codon:yes stop_codon:yes gene_type:complete